MTYAVSERASARRSEVLEHEVALLRRLLAARERECAELRSALVAERIESGLLREDLEHALRAMMDAVRELETLAAQTFPGVGRSGAAELRPISRGEGPEREPAKAEGLPAPTPLRGVRA